MTLLVTGGAGYIGSHMVHALVDAGERVVVLDNLATGFDWAIAKGTSLVVGDLGDQPRAAALIAEHRVDAVIHFAASTVVPDSVHDPLGYYHNNTVNSHALIESAVKGGVRHFIFSSTAAVYGNPERVPVREDDATVPTSPYGSSKLMTEIMLRDVSGVDFEIAFAGRRAGDPAQIVAASDRARSLLKWHPHFDDLQTIVRHALAWERKLLTRAD
jgi:UDP-glucose 4-epimerase